ncbi:MAG TPA: alpha-mannosidase, partial [Chloroflexota bacterium]
MNTDTQTLHMIGNAHLDPVWLWRWQEGFQEAKSTFRSVLSLMSDCDDFFFTSSSAALYEWVERNDPAMFAEIKSRVAQGRWEIAGGWWIQPDCNIPSGESFARQGLYAQRYFAEHLGVTATVGYNVDSFGHAGSLPQILRKSGLTRYVFMRPQPEEMTLPSRAFWWQSGDGSRVLTFRIPFEYGTWGNGVEQQVQRCATQLTERDPSLMCFFGVGNHGGGPTRENLESIRVLAADPSLPALVFSTTGRYFSEIEASGEEFPVVMSDLQHHASGCYSAHSGIKRWNRLAENALLTSETFCALAMRVTSLPYPDDFQRAWKGVLFNQFH